MLVLFYHDDHAQVIVHTANMISRDWTNMTQAVWRSPLLPLSPSMTDEHDVSPIGTGHRFKIDLLRYLQAYGGRLGKLTRQLADYDFSAIRAAFIGSAPSRQKPAAAQSVKQTSFGWLGLQEILSSVPITSRRDEEISAPHVIVQISSIATLGAAPTWLNHLFSVLVRDAAKDAAAHTVDPSSSKTLTFFEKKSSSTGAMAKPRPRPKYNIIFPTPDEIRTSLDGYAAGGSIHIKLQSAQQQKQIEYLTPLLCHWKHSSEVADSNTPSTERKAALRGPAAPHIKTYIRFTDETHKTIDWAMVTSANLSKQAWGDVVNKKEEIWIQSWEAGVVVWPELFAEGEEEVVMVPVFGRDMPTPEDDMDEAESMRNGDDGEGRAERRKKVVGFRMPYDLPLRPYKVGEKPWCATMAYQEPDWKGLAWGGY